MNNSGNTNNSASTGKICAVIPFFNEEKTVGKTVEKVLEYVDFVIAVNDGSTDNSIEKINKLDNVIVLNHTDNLGKGKALRKGFEKSIKLKTKYTVTIDADFQHDPEYIPKFVELLRNYDIVIGNRLHDIKDMPIQRRVSNFLTSFLLTRKLKTNIKDSQCGYRIFKTDILKDILPIYSGFEAESEMIVRAAWNNYKIGFTNIPVVYGGDDSKMKSIQAIKGFLKILFM